NIAVSRDSRRMIVDVRAAVAHQAGQPLVIETVQLAGPKAGEVLVEIKATGICHTEEFTRSGAEPEGLVPAILGHEGAGHVVVFGLGGIGLNVVQGARMVGANMIVGVDLNPGREALARKFGMTHFVNPKDLQGDLVAHLVEITGGGADYSFECIGNVNVMRQALE